MKDDYINGVYYPTTYFYNGGTGEGLRLKLLEMNLDHKQLNKIYKFYSYDNVKGTIEECIDKIVEKALNRVNSWVMSMGNNGRWTCIKPYK